MNYLVNKLSNKALCGLEWFKGLLTERSENLGGLPPCWIV